MLRQPTPLLRLIGLLALLGVGRTATAQMRYAWETVRPGTGVSVQSVALDARGMVVVGTSRGLYRFDGLSFEPIPLGPGPNGAVSRLEAGPDSALWAVMAPSGIVRVAADGSVRRLPFPPGMEHEGYRLNVGGRRLRPDGRGVWIGLVRTLWHYDLRAGRWERRDLPAPQRLRSFALRGDTLWLSDSLRVGYSLLDARRRPGPPRWLADGQLGFAAIDVHPGGGAWAVRPGGVYRLTVPPGTAAPVARRVSAPDLVGAWFSLHPFVGADGSLLASVARADDPTRTLLQHYAPDGRLALDERSANFSATGPALIDREGGLWAVAGEGLAHLDHPSLRLFSLLAAGAHEAEAFATRSYPGGTWISTYNGLFLARPGGETVRAGRGQQTFTVLDVDRRGDARGIVLPEGTPFYAEARTGRVRFVRETPLLHRRDGSILESRVDGLYLRRGAAERRLIDRSSWGPSAETAGPGAPSLTWFILQDRLTALVGDTLASACKRCAPPWISDVMRRAEHLQINGFVVDPQRRLWIAHRAGFDRFETTPDGRSVVQRHFDLGDGEVGAGESVSISPDGQRLWLGTEHGVLGYALGPKMERMDAPLFRLSRRFADGGEAVSDVREDEAGRLWVVVSPGRVHLVDWRRGQAEASPAVQATEMLLNGSPMTPGAGPIRLEAGRDGMRLRFWPATYRDAARVRLEYRLAGRDTAWTNLGLDRTLRFGSLPSGHFRLEVRAVREGKPPGPAFVLPLVSAPPFYRTPVFVALALAFSALASGGLVYLVQARRLAVERLRLRLARDLHDDLGSGLAQISVLSELLARRADAEAAPWADRVGEEARGLTARMRDLVWALRPGDASGDDLADRLRAEASALLRATEIGFEMPTPPEARAAPPLSPEVRRALLLAFREMLTNVVRHARATHVAVHYAAGPHRVSLTVADNGAGLSGATAGGYGLRNLTERAEALGGHFHATDGADGGTVAVFEVPLVGGFWSRRPPKTTQTGESPGGPGG